MKIRQFFMTIAKILASQHPWLIRAIRSIQWSNEISTYRWGEIPQVVQVGQSMQNECGVNTSRWNWRTTTTKNHNRGRAFECRKLDRVAPEVKEDRLRGIPRAQREQLTQYREWHSFELRIGQGCCLAYRKTAHYKHIVTIKSKSNY